jgi:hypothetical protein
MYMIYLMMTLHVLEETPVIRDHVGYRQPTKTTRICNSKTGPANYICPYSDIQSPADGR